MLRCGLLLVLMGVASHSLFAQSQRRLGVVDIESSVLSPQERESLLEALRARAAKKSTYKVLSSDEIRSKLHEKNPLRVEYEKNLSDQETLKTEFEAKIQDGKNDYLASRFEEATALFDEAWAGLKNLSLVIRPEWPIEILKLRAASYFFLGEESKARADLATLLDLDPSAALEVDRFPPSFVQIFNSVQSEPRYVWQVWQPQTSDRGVSANLLGVALPVIEGDKGLTIRIPRNHPVLGNQTIVLKREGSVPIVESFEKLPSVVQFRSLGDRTHPTQGLFAPLLPGNSPPKEFKWFEENLQLAASFLGSVHRDTRGAWVLEGQLLESKTLRASMIATSSGEDLKALAEQVVDQLLGSVSKSGEVIVERPPVFSGETVQKSDLRSPKAFYKTWWFWTLAGVGVAGASVGTYFLLNPEKKLEFQLKGP
jgi:Skp family chaperone for outer membrane proteins